MEPGLTRNLLHVTRADFKHATKVFTRKRLKMGPVLMAFEGGFLSFESGDVRIVMRADGEWQGRATFSPDLLRALATVPPDNDPIPISYAEQRILIGGMTIPCQWSMPRQELAQEIENPGLVDLLALNRTLTRAEIHGSELGKRINSAVGQADRVIKAAAARLGELDVSEEDIRALVEARIAARIGSADEPADEVECLSPEEESPAHAPLPPGLTQDEERLLEHYRDSPWEDRTELLYRIARLRFAPFFAEHFDRELDARDSTYLYYELEQAVLLQFPREFSSFIAELCDSLTWQQFEGLFEGLAIEGWDSVARVILGAAEHDGRRADELYRAVLDYWNHGGRRRPAPFCRKDALALLEAWREGVLELLFMNQDR